tara:strand:- start:85 stop:345 length:261 start_codon:yes stop_codon:yes gene_type:complete
MSDITKAIFKLRPDSEFSLTNNDYSTIKWDKLEGNPPTQAEIDAALTQVEADELAAKAKVEADKATAQAKLAALGLTADDLKALGL